MSANLPPFEQGRSFHSQFTARRMNDIQRAIPRIRFSGGGTRVSNMGGQTFVQMPRSRTSPSNQLHPLTVYDKSIGPVAQVGVTPGVFVDIGNSFTLWVPEIGGVPINTQTGMPPAFPVLIVADDARVVYAFSSIDSSTGFITFVGIASANTLPTSDGSNWYLPLSTISVIIAGVNRSVKVNNDGVSGSQEFQVCAPLPLTDGSGYQSGVF